MAFLNEADELGNLDVEVPEGWAKVFLGELGKLYCGQSPATQFVNVIGNGTPYMTGPDQWDGGVLHVDKWTTDPRRTVPEGCVFVTVKGAGVGTIFPGAKGAIGRDIYAFKPAAGVHETFVRCALEFTVFDIKTRAAGDIPGLSKDHLLKHQINVPPAEEQKRIIRTIEQLFSQVASARNHLSRLPAILKRFRQAVLAAACSGKLTDDWRQSHPEIESGVSILKYLQTKCDPESLHTEGDLSTEAPQEWARTNIESILRKPVSYGILKPGKPDPNGIPMIRILDIGEGRLNRTEIMKVSRAVASGFKRTELEAGDVLLAIMATVGRVAVVPTELSGANVNRALAVLKPKPYMVPQFISLVLRSPIFQSVFETEKLGSAQARINLTTLRTFPFPLPTQEEQQEIVRRVLSLFKLAEAIEKRLAGAMLRVEKLTSSIFGKAFRGELVPTEAELARREGREYEPASVLLERIKAEREAMKLSLAQKSGRKKATSGREKAVSA